MFAGPNGSGKSTLKACLPAELLGVYLNADEIEQEVRKTNHLHLASYGVTAVSADVLAFFAGSSFLESVGFGESARALTYADGRLDFSRAPVNSYLASVAVDFLRTCLIRTRTSFTFETVMSHPDKVQFFARARQAGFRTSVYYVATDDPVINISRVRNRVAQGGHAVPKDRIISRYHRSLDLLMDAIRHSHRAYLFDNSGDSSDPQQTWVAEIIDGTALELKSDRIPSWFRRGVLDKSGP
jgi:predicted ABC-type ATPase